MVSSTPKPAPYGPQGRSEHGVGPCKQARLRRECLSPGRLIPPSTASFRLLFHREAAEKSPLPLMIYNFPAVVSTCSRELSLRGVASTRPSPCPMGANGLDESTEWR